MALQSILCEVFSLFCPLWYTNTLPLYCFLQYPFQLHTSNPASAVLLRNFVLPIFAAIPLLISHPALYQDLFHITMPNYIVLCPILYVLLCCSNRMPAHYPFLYLLHTGIFCLLPFVRLHLLVLLPSYTNQIKGCLIVHIIIEIFCQKKLCIHIPLLCGCDV